MLKQQLTSLIVAGMFAAAGAAQASTVFPSASEDYGISDSALLPGETNAVDFSADSKVFPSASLEGSEQGLPAYDGAYSGRTMLIAMGPESIFPSSNGD